MRHRTYVKSPTKVTSSNIREIAMEYKIALAREPAKNTLIFFSILSWCLFLLMQKLRTTATIGCGPQQNTSKHTRVHKVASFSSVARFLSFFRLKYSLKVSFQHIGKRKHSRKKMRVLLLIFCYRNFVRNKAFVCSTPAKSYSRLKVFPCSIIYDLRSYTKQRKNKRAFSLPTTVTVLFTKN